MHSRRFDSLSVLAVAGDPDDGKTTSIAIREACRAAGLHCGVAVVGTLADALASVTAVDARFDAAVVYTGLPDCEEIDGLMAIHGACARLPIVFVSDTVDFAAAAGFLRHGAADCIGRDDLDPRRLLRAIRFAVERKLNEAELISLARTDSLTGLLNRRAFFDQLGAALVQARRSELACSVILFDIDDFKEVNDVFGHKVGDDVLVEVGRRLNGVLRESDSIARIGGDEFAVLATNLKSAADAMEIAGKLSGAVASIDRIGETCVELSISVGISVFPMDNVDADALVSHADIAMYKSKAARSGAVSFFDAGMDETVKARHALKHSMPRDIAGGRFYLLFQPIVDAASRRIVGAEGLARWRDPDDKVIAPAEFIPIAEESGSIGVLGNCLIEEACAQIRNWSRTHGNLVPISLNISPIQCRDPGFALRLIGALERSDISPALINIEITETAIFKSLDVIQRNLETIKRYGIGVHIDDFGTGYSSLSLLRDLPLNTLKIDRSFVRDLADREAGVARVVQAIIDLSGKFGLRTIAEGVETENQAALLREMGVDALQGYYFSRPVTGARFADWLARSEPYLVA